MADIRACDDTTPHLAHVWTTILDRLVCVGVGLRLVTSDAQRAAREKACTCSTVSGLAFDCPEHGSDVSAAASTP